jgi:hypothetical protein
MPCISEWKMFGDEAVPGYRGATAALTSGPCLSAFPPLLPSRYSAIVIRWLPTCHTRAFPCQRTLHACTVFCHRCITEEKRHRHVLLEAWSVRAMSISSGGAGGAAGGAAEALTLASLDPSRGARTAVQIKVHTTWKYLPYLIRRCQEL